MTPLGDLPGGDFASTALGISADGSVVVGVGTSASGNEAFRWESGVMTPLGDLPGGDFASTALGISADGSVVVGFSGSASGDEAFVWDEVNGMRSVRSLLTSAGLDMTDWELIQAWDVSDDGSVIVGNGDGPSSLAEGWRATIPEPTTAVTVTILGFCFFARRKRSRN